jgi:uncharacterized protein
MSISKPLISSTFIFVDRRKTGRGKSVSNRQKLLDRIRDSIRQANPKDIDDGGVKGGSAHSASSKKMSNPVSIARDALHEPSFHYDPDTGEREVVLVGNDHWERGDDFPVNPSGSGKGSGKGEACQGGDGEDDLIINVSRSEFYDVYFEDCELPDLQETSEKVMPEAVWKPAGFQKEGNAAQLSVIRSFRNSIGRRRALTVDARDELQELEEELTELNEFIDGNPLSASKEARRKEVLSRIDELRTKIATVPYFEKVDLRYRKSEKVQVKSADAVLVMVMDVSGSMDEERKLTARKFFALQYAFIERRYPNTDLVFIAHTDDAEEMTEEDFFTTRKSGGTTVSPSLKLANDIISSRYDPDQTNIYLSYAGDGDNWDLDNKEVVAELEDRGLLSKLRHAVYVQVGHSYASGFGNGPHLWGVMQTCAKNNPKLHAVKIADDEGVFDAFKSVYGKKGKK